MGLAKGDRGEESGVVDDVLTVSLTGFMITCSRQHFPDEEEPLT